MHYIRFLKPPKTNGTKISALITIVTDLGESFLLDNVKLVAAIRSADPGGALQEKKEISWTGGSRSLAISINVKKNAALSLAVRLRVGVDGTNKTDSLGSLRRDKRNGLQIVSAWSDEFCIANGTSEAAKLVERRFLSSGNRILSIWEETGESIARHIWDAGVGLAARIDYILTGKSGGLPLLEGILSHAASRRLNVLELGCGCGTVGIDLAQSRPNCEVVLTDLVDAEEIAWRNLSGARPAASSTLAFHALDWEEEELPAAVQERRLDLVLVSDCTYNPDSSPALARTLQRLVARSPDALVALAMKVRHPSEAVFFELMSDADLVIGERTSVGLPGDEATGEGHENIDIYVFHGRSRR
ncbi:putative methyltransferase-domain-containing protein [Lineolata rhizophorae]|uniref:Putative methyltransferase-domain-containing protein n=1 Tax=Lineolata rhizophorae TaxID=578093 RepID=A0A6A6NXW7_9PEZI|nr:putative methyltransferase-domain-containing protein [Lineolata rhizophorae]